MKFLTSVLGKEQIKDVGPRTRHQKTRWAVQCFIGARTGVHVPCQVPCCPQMGPPPEQVPDVIEEDTYHLMMKGSLDRYWLISFKCSCSLQNSATLKACPRALESLQGVHFLSALCISGVYVQLQNLGQWL